MDKVEESQAALDSRDWSNVEIDRRQRKVTMVHSVRLTREVTEQLFAEAQRRGISPSQLIRELVEAGLSVTVKAATVNVADVHRAIDTLGRKSA